MKAVSDSGIYAITSPSGKQYIGQASSIMKRWIDHRWALKAGKHHCKGLQSAWNKYGKEALIFSVLSYDPIELLNEREQAEINARPRHMLYNGATLVRTPMLGRKHTKTTRQLMSNQRRGENHPNWGKKRDPETVEKMRLSKVGKKLTPEHAAAISAALKGRFTGEQHSSFGKVLSAESRARLSAATKGERNPNWGKVFSAEVRAKMSAAQKARGPRPPSEAHRLATRLAKQNMTPEQKERMAAKMRGANNVVARAVRCVDTGMEFVTGVAAEQWLRTSGKEKASRSAICMACQGKKASAYGYRWEYVNKDNK